MKNRVTLRRFYHRESDRIGIFFSYDEKIRLKVKTIPGVKYSATNKCFYADDTEENIREIVKTLKDSAEIDIEPLTAGKKQKDEHNNPGNIQKPNTITPVAVPERSHSDNRKTEGSVEFRINEETGSLLVRLPIPYSKEWVGELKSFRGKYDSVRREWIVPWSKLNCDSLSDYFSRAGIEVDVKKERVNEDLRNERKRVGDDIRDRELGRKVLDGLDSLALYLDENRYSTRTREVYLSMLEFFFRYFSGKDPEEIRSDEISEFIHNIIIKLGYSDTYQNQMISALKTYYLVMGRGQVNFEHLNRPRKRRSLPKTFSKEEVVRILNSSGNIKHKILLWIIYSCGLRRSEAINIRLMDIDRIRGIIHIREGKGRVDRIVPVPDKVWQKVDEYLASYSPREYLFEGQTGGRYSSESVYRVFKLALVKAGIRKDVGVHSLRHSYATHLHENGLDIKYIQELLGHKSTRTTEIYTHVSRRNLVAVRSPIEDLDVK